MPLDFPLQGRARIGRESYIFLHKGVKIVTEADPYPGPNGEVLEAQARVCTGPHQSRPLGKKEGDPDPGRILELILASLKGDLPRAEQVSPAQMGAFFAAMSIRRTFGAQTGWERGRGRGV